LSSHRLLDRPNLILTQPKNGFLRTLISRPKRILNHLLGGLLRYPNMVWRVLFHCGKIMVYLLGVLTTTAEVSEAKRSPGEWSRTPKYNYLTRLAIEFVLTSKDQVVWFCKFRLSYLELLYPFLVYSKAERNNSVLL
jgi:hypothetical protein